MTKFFQGFLFEVSKTAGFPIVDTSAVSKMQKLRTGSEKVNRAAATIAIRGNRGASASVLNPVAK